jgi:hypothetical protein
MTAQARGLLLWWRCELDTHRPVGIADYNTEVFSG